MTPQELAASLTDEEFELLLRARVRTTLAALDPKGHPFVCFWISTYDIEKMHWDVGVSSDHKTKGEILSECVTEFNRRSGFKSTLRLIEGTVEP